MLRIVFSALVAASLTACTRPTAEASKLSGTWRLTAQLADIGDGSGTYQPIESDRLLVVHSDGTFETNYDYCDPAAPPTGWNTGKYSSDEGTMAPDCDTERGWRFQQTGDTLTLNFQCIEACGDRYVKVSEDTRREF